MAGRIRGIHHVDDDENYDFLRGESLISGAYGNNKDYKGQRIIEEIEKVREKALEILADIYAMNVFAKPSSMAKKLAISLELDEVGEIPLSYFNRMLMEVKEELLSCKKISAEEVYAGEVRNMVRISEKIEKHFDKKPNSQMAMAMIRANEIKQHLLGLTRPNSSVVVINNNNNHVQDKGLPSSVEMQKMPIEELRRLLEEKRRNLNSKKIIDIGE